VDASLPLLLASWPQVFRHRARYSARSAWARFKAPAEHLWVTGLFDYRLLARADRRATSLEVSLFPFSVFRLRRTVRSYHVPDDPASAFRDLGTHARDRFALAVFNASRLRIRALIGLKTPPAGSFMTAFLFSHVTGPSRAIIAAWPGFLFPATLMGFSFPSQFCSALRVIAPRGAFAPTCRFTNLPAARFFFAGFVQNERTGGATGRGFWGLAPRSSRAVLSIGPAIAFTHRAD